MSRAWGCRRLREEDGVAGSGTAWGRRHHRLGDSACVVDGVTGLGRGRWRCIWRARPGLGTTARRLWGGHDEGMGSEEVDDSMSSREIFNGTFLQPNGMSENLWD
jgi:hypothetical protein